MTVISHLTLQVVCKEVLNCGEVCYKHTKRNKTISVFGEMTLSLFHRFIQCNKKSKINLF